MYVGFRLFERLSVIAPCIEVFPQATVRAIGAGSVHKSKLGAVEGQLLQAAKYTGWPSGSDDVSFGDIGFASSHDRLDAYLSAWVAALPESERIPMGESPEDVIWVPRVGSALFSKPVVSGTHALTWPKRRPTLSSGKHERICPACRQYTFKRWPFGWDAHAAHKCMGLLATGQSERKEEYREKYAHLFLRKRR